MNHEIIFKRLGRIRLNYRKYQHTRWFKAITNPPVVVFVIILTLSILGISGSSIGMYSHFFNKNGDSNLLVGNPSAIRSDEWLVNSQMLLAQKNADYPYINENIGNGQNMSLVIDVPYKEWSILFKPQNWIFFIAPFDFSFALKWWLLIFAVFCSAYYLCLHFLPKKRLVATLLALALSLSPFIQWWLTPGITMIIALSLFITLLLLKIHESREKKKKIIYSSILSYCLVCFALILYPPFQIPCMLVVLSVYISVLFKYRREKNTWISVLYIASSAILSLIIIGLYLLTRLDAVQAILNTDYPGARIISSGDVSLVHTLSTFVSPFLQNTSQAFLYTNNQSEASNFALPIVTIIIVSITILILKYRKSKEFNFTIATLLVLLCIFLARMTIPLGDGFYNILLLGSVPNLRLIVGVGLITFILLVLCVKYILNEKDLLSEKIRWLIVTICSIIYSSLLFSIIDNNPGFMPNTITPVLLLILLVLTTWLLVNRHVVATLILIFLFSLLSVINIHPLYKGTDILTQNALSIYIQKEEIQHPELRWTVNNNIQLENFPLLNGAPSLSGVFVSPQVNLFTEISPQSDKKIFNRYAHVVFDFNKDQATPDIKLNQADSFSVKINPCDPVLQKFKLGYIISTTEINSTCLTRSFTYETGKSEPQYILVYKIDK